MALLDRIRWDARHLERDAIAAEPEAFLREVEAFLPRTGLALDLAGGCGRNAAWLAGRGLDVTLADISPIALDRVSRLGLAIRTVEIDLEEDPIPAGPWNLVLVSRFLHRPLYRAIADRLAPGGLAVVIHPTTTNLARHDRPPRRYLLEPGELPGLLPGLEPLRYDEGWTEDGRHEARFLGRRVAGGGG